jgi:hypothetical protein
VHTPASGKTSLTWLHVEDVSRTVYLGRSLADTLLDSISKYSSVIRFSPHASCWEVDDHVTRSQATCVISFWYPQIRASHYIPQRTFRLYQSAPHIIRLLENTPVRHMSMFSCGTFTGNQTAAPSQGFRLRVRTGEFEEVSDKRQKTYLQHKGFTCRHGPPAP